MRSTSCCLFWAIAISKRKCSSFLDIVQIGQKTQYGGFEWGWGPIRAIQAIRPAIDGLSTRHTTSLAPACVERHLPDKTYFTKQASSVSSGNVDPDDEATTPQVSLAFHWEHWGMSKYSSTSSTLNQCQSNRIELSQVRGVIGKIWIVVDREPIPSNQIHT